jgi:hypothetical protein
MFSCARLLILQTQQLLVFFISLYQLVCIMWGLAGWPISKLGAGSAIKMLLFLDTLKHTVRVVT